jgi:oxaloacetate decarboxylase alpha subunit
MVSTLKRQLTEAGAENRLPEVFQEIIQVRKDLGFPIMVTPLSQFVGTQATMNVIAGERYKIIPDGIIEYALGYFGEPPGEIDEQVLARINSLPKARQMRERKFPQPEVEEIREEMGLGDEVSDEEFLLRYALGDKDVDAMLNASSAS